MIKRIVYIIFGGLLISILLLNIFSLFNLSFLGFRIYRVGSGSMEPYLNVNDLIIIKASNKYELNDVVTFENNGDYITHRVVYISENQIITRGDANNTDDFPITEDKIIGKVIYKLKIFGFISYLFIKPISWILLFILGFIITIFIPDKKS